MNEYVRTARSFPFEAVRLLVPCLFGISTDVCISSICSPGIESEVVASCFRFTDVFFFALACCDELGGRTLGTLFRTGGVGCGSGCLSATVDDTLAGVVDSGMVISILSPLADRRVSTVLGFNEP